jgi:hypothetical protein
MAGKALRENDLNVAPKELTNLKILPTQTLPSLLPFLMQF